MSKIIVAGINGFVGKHLSHELVSRGVEIIGVGMQDKADPAIKNLLSSYHECDLTNSSQVSKLPLKNVSSVINLAGLAKVGDSFSQPDFYKKVNVGVMTVMGQRILDLKLPVRMIAVSTGAVYKANQDMPLTEKSAILNAKEGSPYAQSKIAMEKAVKNLKKEGLDCVIVRPFNHVGPGQEPGFLVPDLYQKLSESPRQTLKVGDLSTKRDYTDVRDVVKAYADLATKKSLSHLTYNVCSGRSIEGQKILDLLLGEMNLVSKIKVTQDFNLVRPNDPKNLFGSSLRLTNETGWQPLIPIEKTIKDIVAFSS